MSLATWLVFILNLKKAFQCFFGLDSSRNLMMRGEEKKKRLILAHSFVTDIHNWI